MSQPEMIGSFAAPPPPAPRRPRLRRIGALAGAGVAAGAGIAVWQGARVLADAPGQAALEQLVPREALGALAVDFKPRSLEQVQVMRRISTSLNTEGLTKKIQEGWDNTFTQFPVMRELRPHLAQSGAFAGWEGTGGKSDYRYVVIATINSATDVEAILAKRAESTTTEDGIKVAKLRTSTAAQPAMTESPEAIGNSVYAAVVDKYLLMGSSPEATRDVISVWRGKRESLSRDPKFASFRATLPHDANIIGYLSPRLSEVARQAAVASSSQAATSSFKNVQGGAFSVALREAGVRFDSTTQMGSRQMDALRGMATLDPKIVSRIPGDALGFWAIAQPNAYYDATETALEETPTDARREWDRTKQKFENESGLSIATDIRPALGGDAAIALHAGEKTSPIQFTALLTDARGAQPAALLEKIQGAIKKQDAKAEFVARQEGSITYWGIPRTASDKVNWAKGFTSLQSADGQQVTLYATVGQTALAASSRPLLESAVNAYEGRGGFTTATPLPANTQMLIVARPRALVDAAARLSPEMFHGGTITADDARAVWGDQDIVMSGTYSDKYVTGSTFLPLQYEKATDLIARIMLGQKPATETQPVVSK